MGSVPHIVEDCMGVLQVFSDGSVNRCSLTDINFNIPVIDDGSVGFKDITFDQKNKLSLRLYKPISTNQDSKLPVVFYFHGGGFCLGSHKWPNYHNCCIRLLSVLRALVVSPDYRLAPEHKLPAAIDDATSAVEWLLREALGESTNNRDAWIGRTADFDRVFVLGDSSGGNMAHHLAVRLATGSVQLAPIRVRGFVLLAPFFGGVERTKSEEGPCKATLSLEILDRYSFKTFRASIPVTQSRNHPMVNPFGPNSPNLEKVALDSILVIVGGNELLKDRVESYWRKLKDLGKKIECVEFEGEQRGFLMNDSYSEVSDEALQVIKRFMTENSN
ncbi:carboxylesterase 15-like [Pyrus communis]|uniref:carboxylesterase 15-like n=1 Tax=Pyrus communis TaxID=23211 RepID=UPI0035C0DC75